MSTVLHDILARGNLSPITRQKYIRHLNEWIAFAGEDPSGWTRMRMQEFYGQLLARGVSIRAANVYVSGLRFVSKWYAMLNAQPGLDFAIIQTQREANPKVGGVLGEAEIRALIDTCAPLAPIDRRDRAMLIVGLETGMRRKSLAGMTLENIGKRAGCMRALVPIKGKGGVETWDVPLSDTSLIALEDWRKWLYNRGIKQGPTFPRLKKRLDKTGRLGYVPSGTLTVEGVYAIIKARADAAGLPEVYPHLLRHTYYTTRTELGLSPEQRAAVTGVKLQGLGPQTAYIDLDALGIEARNATPEWFATYVRKLYE